MARKQFTIGTDPEFFLKRGRSFLSAIPYIVGTKHDPAPLKNGGTVQRDNVAVEFATPPAETKEQFVEAVKGCIAEVMAFVPEKAELVAVPSANFPKKELQDPEALEFGCDPDFNAWTISQNEKPDCGVATFRSCGAHVHVGGLDEKGKPIAGLEFLQKFNGKIDMVRAMDVMLGIPSTILDNSKEAIDRRQLYGKAGCHRPTPYGIEYRSLSNYWMKSPNLVMLVYHLTQDAIVLVQKDILNTVIQKIGEEDIQRIINTGDAKTALRVMEQFIMPNMSNDSLGLWALSTAQLPNLSTLKKEWSL
jgi:hypothetical protein